MSDLEAGLNGLQLLASLVGVWLSYRYVLYRSIRDDWRQELFAIRNELWDAMRAANTLDLPAHHELRRRINALIRAADWVNLVTLVWIVWRRPVADAIPLSELIDEVQAPEARIALATTANKLASQVATRVLLTTLPGALIGLPLYACVYGYILATRLAGRTRLPASVYVPFRAMAERAEKQAVNLDRAERLAHMS